MATLYFGDNLGVLRDYVEDESVDLIYLDPPFNSQRDYNVLFSNSDRRAAPAQITAFEDTWHWDTFAERTYQELVGEGPRNELVGARLVTLVRALRQALGGDNDMVAYLVMMAIRLVEMRRVLRETGTLVLHCDPVASHYLKALLDAIFGPERFQNEIIWQRTTAKALQTRRLPNNHDVLLVYRKGDDGVWNGEGAFQKYDAENLDEKTRNKYRHADPDGRLYRLDNLINPNPDRPNLTYEFLGVTKVWRWTRERMQAAYDAGIVVQTRPGAVPQMKRYLDEQRGRPLGDVWTDIPPLNSQAAERIGYPTQKPVALLSRIVALMTSPGAVVLDPFCGCGTTIDAAQRLGRDWIGIDITHLAVDTIRKRIARDFGPLPYVVSGNPADADSARVLAEMNHHQFQQWAVRAVGGRNPGGTREAKRGRDRGIDGELFFRDGGPEAPSQRIIIQVKGGAVSSGAVRDLRGTIEREQCPIGVLVMAGESTKEMRTEAARAGQLPAHGLLYPRLQILTIEDLFKGRRVEFPGTNVTQGATAPIEQLGLFEGRKPAKVAAPLLLEHPRRKNEKRRQPISARRRATGRPR